VGEMLYESYEVLGTDKPIFRVKPIEVMTYDEILHLDESPNDYEVYGYVQVTAGAKTLFQPVYKKKG
jgi:hypothetical protein